MKKINWPAVRHARRRLDELARKHPELVGSTNTASVRDWEEIMKKKEKDELTQTAFRLPNALLERLDRHAQRMQDDSPGLTVTRTDVVRMLLTRGLDEAEQAGGRRRR